ncbi:hypothetical protein K474DRAFT_1659403 [Panus rudis PR-1116 ss-1]|nr:hypothetical protein K474DRAFT_1659403 [Panus rudis PR-1116 ss-1]
MAPSKPYSGTRRRLVLAFDVGTTYSGVGYAIMDPGIVPTIQTVTRFPGQANGDAKIPTVLYYTQDGRVRYVGAEAISSTAKLEAEDEDLIFVQWFKLHLRPESMANSSISQSSNMLNRLPTGKSVLDVFSDFLKYLFDCARAFIVQSHANGESIWNSVSDQIDFVLSHPNGWEGPQQSKMRQTVVQAGLVPDTASGHSRVQFVTEGEASLHYCLDNGLASDVIKKDSKIMIVDAGGGTIDISTYTITNANPISVEESTAPDCLLHGSTRVNVRAHEYLREKLQNSRYGNDEDIQTMLEDFDKSAKVTFRSESEKSIIKFGSSRDRDLAVGIRSGQLVLEGTTVAGLFRPSIAAILDATSKQIKGASGPITTAFLVGGFAASAFLFTELKRELEGKGLTLYRPDKHTNKAVAEGAVSFFLEHFVTVRVIKAAYGTRHYVELDPDDANHMLRAPRSKYRLSGRRYIPDKFTMFLANGSRIRENEEHAISLFIEAKHPSVLNLISSDIECYRGIDKKPEWTDLEPESFSTLCTVTANTSKVKKVLRFGPEGEYYTQDFKVILLCGLTEMKAQISWLQNGVEKRGPASVVYDVDPIS